MTPEQYDEAIEIYRISMKYVGMDDFKTRLWLWNAACQQARDVLESA